MQERGSAPLVDSDDDLKFVMKLKANADTVECVVVGPQDDAFKLASSLGQKHNLSDKAISTLATKIERRRSEFLLQVLDAPFSQPISRQQSPVPSARAASIRSTPNPSDRNTIEDKDRDHMSPSVKEIVDSFIANFDEQRGPDNEESAAALALTDSDKINPVPCLIDEADQEEIFNRALQSAFESGSLPSTAGKTPERNSDRWAEYYEEGASEGNSSSPNSVFIRLYRSASLQQQCQEQLAKKYQQQEQQKIDSTRYCLPLSSPYNSRNLTSPVVKEGENFCYNLYHRDLQWQKSLNESVQLERKKKDDALRQKESELDFKPKLFPLPESISLALQHREREDIHKYLHDAKIFISRDNTERRTQIEQKRIREEIPLRPNISHRSERLSAQSYKRRELEEELVRTEVEHGEITPALSKAMRRSSVMKLIEKDFSLGDMTWNFSHINHSDTSVVTDSSQTPKTPANVISVESRTPYSKSAASSLFQSMDEVSSEDLRAIGLKDMLIEDATRISEIMREKEEKSIDRSEASNAGTSIGSPPKSITECGLSIAPSDPVIKARPDQIAMLDQGNTPKYFVPTPGKSPIFRVSELHLTQLQQKAPRKDGDMSERREGELSPRTKRKMKEAADLLKNKVIGKSTPSLSSSSSRNGDFKKSIFEHLYQDHFYRAVHSVKREIAARKVYTHRPDIGVNKHISVESRKKDFFQRLYSHEDPNIGNKKRSASADAMRARSVDRCASSRSRSVSRVFTSSRRRDFEGVQRVVSNCSKLNTNSNKWKSDCPWGRYQGVSSLRDKNKTTEAQEEKKRDTHLFYNYVFSDNNDSRDDGYHSRVGVDAETLSRDQQLKFLADKIHVEATGCSSKKKLSGDQIERLVSRMERDVGARKFRANERKMGVSEEAHETIVKSIRSYSSQGSRNIVDSIRQKALADIFDVLLISAEYSRSQKQASQASPKEENTEQDEENHSHGLLDTTLAVPAMLRPKELAEVIAKVLKDHQPGLMSRTAFIAIVSRFISSGLCPPLNSILAAPYTAGCRARSSQPPPSRNSLKKEQDSAFPSRAISDRYLKGRYLFMEGNNVNHSEIIYAYDEIYRKKLDAIRERLLKDERSVYTFSPIKWTKPEAHSYWLKRAESRGHKSRSRLENIPVDNATDRTSEDVRFWPHNNDEDATAASSISHGTDKSIKSVDVAGAHSRNAGTTSFNSSSLLRSYERPSSFSYYSAYVKRTSAPVRQNKIS